MYDEHTEMARNCNVFNDHQALSRIIDTRRRTERLHKGFAPEIPGNSLGNPYLTSPPKLNARSYGSGEVDG